MQSLFTRNLNVLANMSAVYPFAILLNEGHAGSATMIAVLALFSARKDVPKADLSTTVAFCASTFIAMGDIFEGKKYIHLLSAYFIVRYLGCLAFEYGLESEDIDPTSPMRIFWHYTTLGSYFIARSLL